LVQVLALCQPWCKCWRCVNLGLTWGLWQKVCHLASWLLSHVLVTAGVINLTCCRNGFLPIAVCLCCSDIDTKQLQGWKASVENLLLQLNNLVKQQQQLLEMETGLAALHVSSSSSSATAPGAMPPSPAAAVADAVTPAMKMDNGQAALHVSSSSRVAVAGATPRGPAAAAADAAAICTAEEVAAGPLAAGTAALLDKLRCARWTGLIVA
jgi:hypothetical protein